MQKGVISLYNIFEYYQNIFWILFVYVDITKMCHIIIQHFWISSEYFLNIIRICLKCKTCVISLYNIFEYYPNIFWILFLYVESAKKCHIHYSIFLNFIRIFSEFYSYILKCKTCVIFIIQHFWILLEYFLNLIRIFS